MKMDMLRNMNQSAMNTAKINARQTVQTPQQTAQQAHQQVQPLSEQELLEMRLALLNQQEKAKLHALQDLSGQELLKTLQDLKKNFVEIDKDLKKLSSEIQGFHVRTATEYTRTVQAPFDAVRKTAEEAEKVLHTIREQSQKISTSWSDSILITSLVTTLATSTALFVLHLVIPQLLNR